MKSIKLTCILLLALLCSYAAAHYVYCVLTVGFQSLWTTVEASVIAGCALLGAQDVTRWCYDKWWELRNAR